MIVSPRLSPWSSHWIGSYPYWMNTKHFKQCAREGFKVLHLPRAGCAFLMHSSAVVSLSLLGPNPIFWLPDIFNNSMSEPTKKNGRSLEATVKYYCSQLRGVCFQHIFCFSPEETSVLVQKKPELSEDPSASLFRKVTGLQGDKPATHSFTECSLKAYYLKTVWIIPFPAQQYSSFARSHVAGQPQPSQPFEASNLALLLVHRVISKKGFSCEN